MQDKTHPPETTLLRHEQFLTDEGSKVLDSAAYFTHYAYAHVCNGNADEALGWMVHLLVRLLAAQQDLAGNGGAEMAS